MPVILPVDHHATFEGWAQKRGDRDNAKPWSSRRRVGFFVVSAMASWILVLSPFVLLG